MEHLVFMCRPPVHERGLQLPGRQQGWRERHAGTRQLAAAAREPVLATWRDAAACRCQLAALLAHRSTAAYFVLRASTTHE